MLAHVEKDQDVVGFILFALHTPHHAHGNERFQTSKMRFSSIAVAAVLFGAGSASPAFKFGEQEALAAKAVINIGVNAAQNGYPSPKTCTLRNVAVRREW